LSAIAAELAPERLRGGDRPSPCFSPILSAAFHRVQARTGAWFLLAIFYHVIDSGLYFLVAQFGVAAFGGHHDAAGAGKTGD